MFNKSRLIYTLICFLLLFLFSCGKKGPSINEPSYKVAFDVNGGNGDAPQPILGYSGDKITIPSVGTVNPPQTTQPDAEKKFGSWNTEANALGIQYYEGDEYYIGASDITLYATWVDKNKYTVTFNADNGAAPTEIKVIDGEKANKPTDPKKKANSFINWYTDISLTIIYDFNTTVTSNITLYAAWKDHTTIKSEDDLIDLANAVNKGVDFSGTTVTLNNDIEVDASFKGITNFNGTFDGQSNKIDGLEINTSRDNTGFIGTLVTNGVVKDLTVKGSVTGNNQNIGLVVGNNQGTVIGCSSEGTIKGRYQIGGIVGINNGIIERCYNAANVNSTNWAGGIAGLSYGTIKNCYNTGKIRSDSRAGGITTLSESRTTIENCYSVGIAKKNNGDPGPGIIDVANGGTVTLSKSYYLSGRSGSGSTQKGKDEFILSDFGWHTSIWKQKDFPGQNVKSRPVLIGIGAEGK